MKRLLYISLTYALCIAAFSILYAFEPKPESYGFINSSRSVEDTSDVNVYIRRALKAISKPTNIELIKLNIDSAELICRNIGLEKPALLHLAMAEYFFLTGNYKNASEEADTALKISESSGEKDVQAKTLNFLGRYSLRTGFFKESIEYFNKSIAIFKESGTHGFNPKNYNELANTYLTVNDTQAYRATLKEMIKVALAEGDSLSAEAAYYRLGTSYEALSHNFERADSLLRESYKISAIRSDTFYISYSLANLGWNFYLVENYDSSLKYYLKSLKYSIPGELFSASANSYGNIGTIYRDLNESEKALDNYIKGINQAKVVDDWYSLSWIYKDMSDMYLRQNDTAAAYKNFVLFKQFSDSLIIAGNTLGLKNARVQYEADTRNKELELLSLRVRNQRLLIYGFAGGFMLILIIGLLLISRAKIDTKRRISEMNRKIAEITQANLRQQMNPHFIFNTLNSIQYHMYQNDKLATNNYLTKFSSLLRKVLENSQHTSVTLRDELDALNLYMELEMVRFKNKFDYKITIDEEIDTLIYKVPTMLIQPYVENSIRHGLIPGEGKGSIKIDLKLENNFISCTIEDNGIGRKAAQVRKEKSENNYNSLGTQIVSSRLDLVNALYGTSLKTIYTDLKNEKDEPTGTRIEIHIPILT